MKKLLILPHIKIQNANALSSPYTIGFPAMTSWLGFMHALQLRLNKKGLRNLKFNSIAIVSHKFKLHTYKGSGSYDYSIISTSNPLKKDGKRPSTIEEARCHLTVSLIIEYHNIDQDEAEDMIGYINNLLHQMKVASGDVLNFQQPFLRKINSEQETRKLTAQLMPGFCLIERADLMQVSTDKDSMDILFDNLKSTSSCEKILKNDDEKIIWSNPARKEKGWIVPIAIGFYGISDLSSEDEPIENQRDKNIQHRFAESIVTLGEFIMPYRIIDIDTILWQYSDKIDIDNNLYVCKQNKQFITTQEQ